MHPILWEHPQASSYGAMIVLGVIVAWVAARGLARRAGVAASLIDLMVPLLTAAGLVGAALLGRVVDGVTEEAAHASVLFGGMLMATGVGILFSLVMRIPLGVMGDIMAGPILITVACGRVGCFLAGCCYGRVWDGPLGVTYPRGSFLFFEQVSHGILGADAVRTLPVYPVQLFEAALTMGLGIFLAATFGRRRMSGELFLKMAGGYAVIRFCMEFMRGDNPTVAGMLTFSQLVSVGVAIAVMMTWVMRRRHVGRWHLAVAGEARV